jgi:hypothetical protein
MKIPAYVVLRVVSLTLIAIGLSLASLSIVILTSKGNGVVQHREIMLSLGSLLLLIGLIGPVRIVFHGVQIPIEIKHTIAIQAVALPLSGVAFIFAGIMDTSNYVALAYLIVGICAIYSAIAGFYSLSKTLPGTFYISEMVSIFKSTGITGNKKYSQADQAFQRWTTGSEGVATGRQACDGKVVRLDGNEALHSSFFIDRPLVLNFASYSCPHYRKRIDELQVLMEKWQPFGVEFLTVYTAEAHAEDGWKLVEQYVNDTEYTDESDFRFPYARNIHERKEMAKWLISKKHFDMPVVLDTIEDNLLKAYNSWPIRLYIIHEGTIAFCGDQGPFGYNPPGLDPVLQKLIHKNV